MDIMKNVTVSLLLLFVICFTNGCKHEKTGSVIISGYLYESRINMSEANDLSYVSIPDRINFFHVYPDSTGQWEADPNIVDRLNIVRKVMRPEQEIFIVTGGGGIPSEHMYKMASDSVKRESYAEALVNFAHQHNFDGVDVDWETYWGTTPYLHVPKDAYVDLMTLIRNKINALPSTTSVKKLSCALDGNQENSKELAAAVASLVDQINVMVYDAYGTQEEGYPHAPMYMFVAALQNFSNAGVPKHKLVGGVPFYGSNRSETPPKGGNYRTLYNAALEAGTPLTSSMNTFNGVAFNGADLIREKTEFVIKNGYGGIQIWELSHDIPYSNELSLLRTIRKTIDEAKNRRFTSILM